MPVSQPDQSRQFWTGKNNYTPMFIATVKRREDPSGWRELENTIKPRHSFRLYSETTFFFENEATTSDKCPSCSLHKVAFDQVQGEKVCTGCGVVIVSNMPENDPNFSHSTDYSHKIDGERPVIGVIPPIMERWVEGIYSGALDQFSLERLEKYMSHQRKS